MRLPSALQVLALDADGGAAGVAGVAAVAAGAWTVSTGGRVVTVHDRTPALDDLLLTPIAIEWHRPLWGGDEVTARAWARTPLGKYATLQWFAPEFLEHAAVDIDAFVMEDARRSFDRGLRPWARFDRPALPYFEVFSGRLGRVLAWIDRRRA